MTTPNRLRLLGLLLAVCALAAAARPALMAAPGDDATPTSHTDDAPAATTSPTADADANATAAGPTTAADAVAPAVTDAEEPPSPASATDAFLFPVAGGRLSSVIGRYGDPRDGGRRRHLGVDIAAPMGMPVLAPVAGTVERTGSGGAGGRTVWLREAGADRVYYFVHLDAVDVRAGQRVDAGARLGSVGITGNAAGTVPHLHFAVHEGRHVVDPWWFLVAAERLAGHSARVEPLDEPPSMRTRLPGAALRTAPGRGATVAVLPRHQAVTVVSRVEGYYRVRYQGREGYIADWLLAAPTP
jgi:murein DD-endopeptidase MepM/ murein hydrolase activator NlpD